MRIRAPGRSHSTMHGATDEAARLDLMKQIGSIAAGRM
jgi:hypothetical protein